MTRLTLVVGLFALTAGPVATGCSSTSATQSTPDAATNASDDGSFDTAACTAAGGQCVVGSVSCVMKGPQSCGAPGPAGTFCCLDATPQSDAGVDASGLITCVDAGPLLSCADADIQAATYDQTCQTDLDCVLVGEGESCSPCSLACGPFGAIAHSALTQFTADVAKTPAGNLPVSCAPCCDPTPIACCRGGLCHADSQCAAADAATDAGPADAGRE